MAKKRQRKAPAQQLVPSGKPTTPAPAADRLLGDIRTLIEAARQQVAQAVNAGLVAAIGTLAGASARISCTRSEPDMETRLCRAVGTVNDGIRPRVRASKPISDDAICRLFPRRANCVGVSAQLGWSHFVEIIPLDDPLKRDFYVELLPRPPFLPPPAATTRGDRPENWRLPAGRRRPNGVVSSLAE